MAARQSYAEVWTYTDLTTQALRAAKETEVTVYKAGTTEKATIYAAREGGSPMANPFINQENGLVLFWAGIGDYDVKFHDTVLPARFGDYVLGWQSSPVNTEVESSDLSNAGDVTWTQEGTGAWFPTLKSGSVGLTELENAAFIPQSRLDAATQQRLWESGDIKQSGRSTPPTGWLLCDGSSKLRSEYATLFSAIGTSYGSLDGTHFTLPDLRGRSPVGAGSGAGLSVRSLGQYGGEEAHQLTPGQMPYHGHNQGSLYLPGDLRSGQTIGNNFNNYSGQNGFTAISTWVAQNIGVIGETGGAGGNEFHNTMHPWGIVNFFIKT